MKSDNELATEKLHKLARDVDERDRQLSLNVAEAIASGEIKTILYSESARSSVEILAEADRKVRSLENMVENQEFHVKVRNMD